MPPRTVSRRPKDEEQEEEEKPRRRTRQAEADAGDEGDEDRTERKSIHSQVIHKGWGGYHKVKALASDFPENFQPVEEPQLIKFLEDGPFASYRQHWIDETSKRKKSYICAETDCPLCDMGDRPMAKYNFNVLVLSDTEPTVKVWTTGSRIAGTLENYHKQTKTGPLTRLYFAVQKTGKKSNSDTNINPVKERDLPDDWDIDPLEEEEVKVFAKKVYDDSSLITSSRKELQEIADEVGDSNED